MLGRSPPVKATRYMIWPLQYIRSSLQVKCEAKGKRIDPCLRCDDRSPPYILYRILFLICMARSQDFGRISTVYLKFPQFRSNSRKFSKNVLYSCHARSPPPLWNRKHIWTESNQISSCMPFAHFLAFPRSHLVLNIFISEKQASSVGVFLEGFCVVVGILKNQIT